MKRITRDEQGLLIAKVISLRGECSRRKVGAVITDARGRILSTGYNGVAPGATPCTQSPCSGVGFPSGHGLSECKSSHAEISALVTLERPFDAHTIYCTTEPCVDCTKALLLTSISRVVFIEPYPKGGRSLWVDNNREWTSYDENILQDILYRSDTGMVNIRID